MNFKHTTTFSSVLKPLVSEEKDRYLALASLVEVGNFIPEIDTDKNVDLLPVAFNAAVVNRVNRNGDVIDTETALASFKNFINKPINLEHNREKIVGVILTAGFSEFGTDTILTEDQVKMLKGPFNITLGGVIWKIANPNLASMIEDSSDATSSNYQKISASWELGFNDYNVVVIEGESKNIEDGLEITSGTEDFEVAKSSLRALGGSGKIDKTKSVYRKVIGNVVPLGIGLTENPAADVKGVATVNIENVKQEEPEEEKLEENISKIENLNVNNDIDNKIMKITSLKDITDESLKQASASQISDLIEQELKLASEKFAAEKASVENELKATKENLDSLVANQEALSKEIAALKEALSTAEAEKQKILATEKFNERMSAFDSEYDLDADTRQVLASDIASMDDEAFAAYKNKMAVFLKNKKKGEKPTQEDSKEDKKEMKASVEQVIEEVTDKAEKEEVKISNTTSASSNSLFEKYKNAFDYDSFVVKNK
jgi:hypothetical protein